MACPYPRASHFFPVHGELTVVPPNTPERTRHCGASARLTSVLSSGLSRAVSRDTLHLPARVVVPRDRLRSANVCFARIRSPTKPVDLLEGCATGSLMLAALVVVLRSLALICSGHRAVALENLALLQQLAVFRPSLRHRDRTVLGTLRSCLAGLALRANRRSAGHRRTLASAMASPSVDQRSRPTVPADPAPAPAFGGSSSKSPSRIPCGARLDLHHRYERRAAR